MDGRIYLLRKIIAALCCGERGSEKEESNNLFRSPSCIKARFALYYTYAFLPLPRIAKTCQEQVSHRQAKTHKCPPALVGVCAPRSNAVRLNLTVLQKSLQRFFQKHYGTAENAAPSFLLFEIGSVKNIRQNDPPLILLLLKAKDCSVKC